MMQASGDYFFWYQILPEPAAIVLFLSQTHAAKPVTVCVWHTEVCVNDKSLARYVSFALLVPDTYGTHHAASLRKRLRGL